MAHISSDITQSPQSQSEMATAVDDIMAQYHDKTGLVLNTLNDIQERYRYLPEEALHRVSENTGVLLDDLKQMGDFFDYLSLDPTGRYVIEVCDGTCCHIQGAPRLIDKIERVLGIKIGEVTEDGMISIKAVNCVGACGIAPVVISEGRVYGHVRLVQVGEIVAETWDRAMAEES
ncbi:MAG: NAD(P)H-dependent oxidoreductase subunit E [Actinobacteria bacterium]|nr:NAD(P)H-dependent oxidoreductase subunit E [Actinomycetota bacterium]